MIIPESGPRSTGRIGNYQNPISSTSQLRAFFDRQPREMHTHVIAESHQEKWTPKLNKHGERVGQHQLVDIKSPDGSTKKEEGFYVTTMVEVYTTRRETGKPYPQIVWINLSAGNTDDITGMVLLPVDIKKGLVIIGVGEEPAADLPDAPNPDHRRFRPFQASRTNAIVHSDKVPGGKLLSQDALPLLGGGDSGRIWQKTAGGMLDMDFSGPDMPTLPENYAVTTIQSAIELLNQDPMKFNEFTRELLRTADAAIKQYRIEELEKSVKQLTADVAQGNQQIDSIRQKLAETIKQHAEPPVEQPASDEDIRHHTVMAGLATAGTVAAALTAGALVSYLAIMAAAPVAVGLAAGVGGAIALGYAGVALYEGFHAGYKKVHKYTHALLGRFIRASL